MKNEELEKIPHYEEIRQDAIRFIRLTGMKWNVPQKDVIRITLSEIEKL